LLNPADENNTDHKHFEPKRLNMTAETTMQDKQSCYAVDRSEDVAILRLGADFFFESIDLPVSNRLFKMLDCISRSHEVNVLVIKNCSQKVGCEEYIQFCRQVIASEFDRKSIHRVCNVFDQLILKIFDLNKLVIHADCGDVIPIFLNISLACDYRLVAANTVFKKPYFELGLLPKGGTAFFLCKMLGNHKTRQLLESEADIDALEALELGIVDQVLAEEELEKAAIRLARRLSKRPLGSLLGIKRLINYSMKDLKDYLGFESQELMRIMGAF